jgi:AraC-like DNA-binding protein
VAGIREVFHARNLNHAYPVHVHETWTLVIVDGGGIRYQLDRHDRSASAAGISVLPPGVPHDGRPIDGLGFHKRVLYIEPSLLPESLTGHAVDAPAIVDPRLRLAVSDLHQTLASGDDTFRAETLAALVAARITRHLSSRPAPTEAPSRSTAVAFRDLLEQHLFERFTLAEAARALHASPTHLARSFAATFGIPPHQYRLARRIDAARARLLDGEASAEVALSVGFSDQAHLTRLFRQHTGLTPARYAASSRSSH